MFLKKIKKTIIIIITSFIMPISIFAYSDYILVGGENVGIEINSKGVMVVGLYEIDGKYIASEAGIKVGDMIIAVNNQKINNIKDLTKIISESNNKIQIDFIRNKKKSPRKIRKNKRRKRRIKNRIICKRSNKRNRHINIYRPKYKTIWCAWT